METSVTIQRFFPKGFCTSLSELNKFITNVHMFIIANLCFLTNKTVMFAYFRNFILTKNDLKTVFELNQSDIITMSLFNQRKNANDHYQILPTYQSMCNCFPITTKARKYVSFMIPKDKTPQLIQMVNKINTLTDTNVTLVFKNDLLMHNVNLTINENGQPEITNETIYSMFANAFEIVNPDVTKEFQTNYNFCLIYENDFNTNTDLLSMVNNYF